jgi:transposase
LNEERRPIPPAIPGGASKKLNTVTRGLMWFASYHGFQERKLRRLANASAKLFNEINYERRQQFFHEGRVDLKGTYDKYYEKYKG